MANWVQQRNAKLMEWFGGNVEAVHFLLLVSQITELWDDLIDKDVAISDARTNDVFWKIMVELPCNPFFNKHKGYLMPIIVHAINSWKTANTLERGDANQRALAYTLRNMDIQLAEAIVYVTQGRERMEQVSVEMWDYFAARQDNLLEWAAGGAA